MTAGGLGGRIDWGMWFSEDVSKSYRFGVWVLQPSLTSSECTERRKLLQLYVGADGDHGEDEWFLVASSCRRAENEMRPQ